MIFWRAWLGLANLAACCKKFQENVRKLNKKNLRKFEKILRKFNKILKKIKKILKKNLRQLKKDNFKNIKKFQEVNLKYLTFAIKNRI